MFVYFSTSAAVSINNVNIRYNGDQVLINYDLNSSMPNSLYDIEIKIYRNKYVPPIIEKTNSYFNNSPREQVSAYTFTGDVGKNISPGNGKVAAWQVKIDNITLSESIYAVVEAKPALYIPVGRHLLRSALFPGLGEYGLDNKDLHVLKGLLGYGAIAGSIYLNNSAWNNYSSYVNSTNPSASNTYFNNAASQQVYAYSLAGTAVAVWGINLYRTYKKAQKLKQNQSVTTAQSRYYYNYTNQTVTGTSPEKYLEIKGKFFPPSLAVNQKEITITNKNNDVVTILNAMEQVNIGFDIENNGNGDAYGVIINLSEIQKSEGITYPSFFEVGKIKKGEAKRVEIPIKTNLDLQTSRASFNLKIIEENGFGLDPIELNINTKKFISPMLEVVDYKISTEKGGRAKKGEKMTMEVNIQNTGYGDAKDIEVKFIYPLNVYSLNNSKYSLPILKSGEHQTLYFDFLTNNEYKDSIIPINIELSESWKRYAKNKDISVSINQELNKLRANFYGDVSINTNIKPALLTSDVDINIPLSPEKNTNKYAIVIGNEDYSTRQNNLSSESDVEFAISDATIFKEYLVRTLGFDSKNVFLITNATASEIKQRINTLVEIFKRVNPSENEIVFYYAGHGYPDEINKTAYLMPVDVSVSDLNSALKLSDVTAELSKTNAKKISLFLDACFTGDGRKSGLLAARTARIKPKSFEINGNMIVFSASSGDQTALPYREQKHGLFTYFILKKLQESKGDIKYPDLFNYVKTNVSLESTRSIKPQDPEWLISSDISEKWTNWKFK